jgi:hypothetical protein
MRFVDPSIRFSIEKVPDQGGSQVMTTGGYAISLLLIAAVTATPCRAEVSASFGGSRGLSWETHVDARSGTRAEYPAAMFPVDAGATTIGSGQSFQTADGRARLEIYALPNRDHDSPASYVASKLAFRRSALTYDRVAPAFFAVSGTRRGMVYYSRCNFPDGRSGDIHCVYLMYPERETKAWDAIVTRISLSLRPARPGDREANTGGRTRVPAE